MIWSRSASCKAGTPTRSSRMRPRARFRSGGILAEHERGGSRAAAFDLVLARAARHQPQRNRRVLRLAVDLRSRRALLLTGEQLAERVVAEQLAQQCLEAPPVRI